MPLYRCRMCAYHNVVRTGAVSVIRGKRRKEKWCNYFATLMPTRTHKRAACSATNTSSLSDGLVAPCAGSKSSKEDETDAFFSSRNRSKCEKVSLAFLHGVQFAPSGQKARAGRIGTRQSQLVARDIHGTALPTQCNISFKYVNDVGVVLLLVHTASGTDGRGLYVPSSKRAITLSTSKSAITTGGFV